jgi:hypothetical protein
MISKVIKPGKSFAGACRYLCSDRERAEVIMSEGIRNYDHALMAKDFESQRQLNPGLKSPVQHIILSWCPGEIISNELMLEIATEYLKAIEVSNTQYVIVKHNDRDNPHVHILFNRVNNEGRTIKDNFLGLRGKKAAQRLTQAYGLIPAVKKDMQQTQLEHMNGYDATRYEIFQAIDELLPRCQTMEELKVRLEKENIGVVYKFKGTTNEVQGVSFCKGEFKFKGSEIDRSYSYLKLQKLFASKQQHSVYKTKQLNSKRDWSENSEGLSQTTKLLYDLMKPEFSPDYVPNELAKPKKKRRKSLGL